MIPISDKTPTRGLPIVNLMLISANVIVFLYELTLRSRLLDRFIFTWGLVPNNFFAALSHPAQTSLSVWATLITSQFLHAGWAHILGNMIFLWVFGDNVEDILGSFTYLVFYLVCGVVAGIVQVLVIGPGDIPSLGASGAIAGVLGAYLLLYPFAKVTILLPIFFLFWGIDLPALLVIGWWFVQQLFYGLGALSSAAASGIAFWAHIGGFAMGALLILPYLRRVRPRRRAVSYYDASDDYVFPRS
jgi:membrane associated rhomboid family serine protease